MGRCAVCFCVLISVNLCVFLVGGVVHVNIHVNFTFLVLYGSAHTAKQAGPVLPSLACVFCSIVFSLVLLFVFCYIPMVHDAAYPPVAVVCKADIIKAIEVHRMFAQTLSFFLADIIYPPVEFSNLNLIFLSL